MTSRVSLAAVVVLCLAGCDTSGKLQVNYPCSAGEECISETCHGGLCVSANPNVVGESCLDHGDCLSLHCANGTCANGIRWGGKACRHHVECITNACQAGKCTGPEAPEAGMDAGTDGPGPDLPLTDARGPDGPVTDAPLKDGPRSEGPQLDLKKPDGPKADVKKLDGPKADKPKPDLPKSDLPQSDKALPDLPSWDAGTLKTQDPAGIPISMGPATPKGDQVESAVAYGGKAHYLVVWKDTRDGNADVYGARVNKVTHKVEEPGGIPISKGTFAENSPAVAFDGTNYLVVWSDSRNLGKAGHDIYGTLVDQQGKVLSSGGIKITGATLDQKNPAVAFGGGSFLVVWEDTRNSSFDLYGARVSKAGAVLDKAGIKFPKGSGNQKDTALAYGGNTFLVVWQEYSGTLNQSDIHGALVDKSGKASVAALPISSPKLSDGITLTGNKTAPAVAYGGKEFLVVWQNDAAGSTYDIHGKLITTGGKPLHPKTTHIIIANHSSSERTPAVAFDGVNYLVVWSDNRWSHDDLYGKRVSTAGKPLAMDGSGVAVQNATNNQNSPALAWSGLNYLVVWDDLRKGNFDVYGARVVP